MSKHKSMKVAKLIVMTKYKVANVAVMKANLSQLINEICVINGNVIMSMKMKIISMCVKYSINAITMPVLVTSNTK
jgi:hypothetical protein